MPRLALALVFLALVSENGTCYAKLIQTPLGTLDTLFFGPSFLKLPFFFFVVAGMLAFGPRAPKEPPIARMRSALLVSISALVVWAAFGIATGGVFQQVPWQIYNLIVMWMFALVLFRTILTSADMIALGKVVLAAAVWRALAAILFYLFVVRSLPWDKIPPYMTTHDDSTLFVTGIALVFLYALNVKRRKVTRLAVVVTLVIAVAIQLNNRRLAWMSLPLSLLFAYFVLPPGAPARQRVKRMVMILAPIAALYLVVGWGRKEAIFKPLASFASIDATKDTSTLSREVEDSNLIVTAGRGPFIGRGFGHKFDAVNTTFELDGVFDQWQYIPHNSYLGLLAFTGVFGFAAIWLPLPICVFLAARGTRAAVGPIERTAGSLAAAEVVIFANQAYGDMGLQSQTSVMLVACACAVAVRVAVATGAWERVKRPAPARAATSAPASQPGSESRARAT